MSYRADGDVFAVRRSAAPRSAAAAAGGGGGGDGGGGGGGRVLVLFNFGPRAAWHEPEEGGWRAAEVGRALVPEGYTAEAWGGGGGARVAVPPYSAVVLEGG